MALKIGTVVKYTGDYYPSLTGKIGMVERVDYGERYLVRFPHPNLGDRLTCLEHDLEVQE